MTETTQDRGKISLKDISPRVEVTSRDYFIAEEQFLAATRQEIKRMLRERNVRQIDLSRRLGISKARVSYLLSGKGTNLTIRFIARIFLSLDEEPVLTSRARLVDMYQDTTVL